MTHSLHKKGQTMNTTTGNLAELASEDGVVRERARKALIAEGGYEIVHAQIGELTDPRRQVRWEAVMVLSGIADPVSALPLVHAMEDQDSDIAWIAAEGVAKLSDSGLAAVLSRLTNGSSSTQFCRLALHSLKLLRATCKNAEELDAVMHALDSLEPTLAAPVAAYEALQKLSGAANFGPASS